MQFLFRSDLESNTQTHCKPKLSDRVRQITPGTNILRMGGHFELLRPTGFKDKF